MQASQRLLKLRAADEARRKMLQLKWAWHHRDHLFYVFLRSRGFMIRHFTGGVTSLIELATLSVFVSHELLLSLMGLLLTQSLLAGLSSSLIEASRGTFLDGRRFPASLLQLVVPPMHLFGLILAFFLLRKHLLENEAEMIFFIAYGIRGLVSTLCSSVTSTTVFKRRIYIPWSINYAWVGLTLLFSTSVLIFSNSQDANTPKQAFVTVLLFNTFLTIAFQIYLFTRIRKRSESVSHEGPFFSRVRKDAQALHAHDLKRAVLFSSQYVILFSFTLYGLKNQIHAVVIAGAFLQMIFLKFLLRVFRSFSVDYVQAVFQGNWKFIERSFHLSRRTVLISWLIVSTIALAGQACFGNLRSLPVMIWLLGSIWNYAQSTGLATIGMDRKFFWEYFAFRSVAIPLFFILVIKTVPYHFSFLALMLMEALLALWIEFRLRKADLAREIRINFVGSDRAASPALLRPAEFLAEYARESTEGDCSILLLSLRRKVRSHEHMIDLKEAIHRHLPDGCSTLAISERKIAVGILKLSGNATEKIREDLICELFVELEEIQLLPLSLLPIHLGIENLRPEPDLLSPDLHERLALVEQKVGICGGEWLVRTPEGLWKGSRGPLDAIHQGEFENLYLKFHRLAHLENLRLRFYRFRENEVFLFRPYGEILAAYSISRSTPEVISMLKQVGAHFLAAYLIHAKGAVNERV